MTEGLAGFLAAYTAEAEEHLAAADAQALLIDASLRKGESNARAVRELFRALHTLKGLSAMVGVEPVVAVTHRMETALRAADRAGGRLSLPTLETLLRGLQTVASQVRALADGRDAPEAPRGLLDALAALEADVARADDAEVRLDLDPAVARSLAPFEVQEIARGARAGRRAVRVDFVPSRERAEAGQTITTARERVGRVGDIVKVVPLSVAATERAPGGIAFALVLLTSASDEAVAEAAWAEPASVRVVAAPRAAEPEVNATRGDEPEVASLDVGRRDAVRVDRARVDAVLDALAPVFASRARVSAEVTSLRAAGGDTRAIAAALSDDARRLRELRAAVLRLRMVPLAEVLGRVNLVVRGLQRSSGKLVRLEVDAGDAECDKVVADQVFPAVVHVVRNAVDHGVETPEERRRAGKPEEATLRVVGRQRSSAEVEVTVSDDGRGVDAAAVASRAGEPAPADDEALLAMLCRAGLSTRASASAVSGRGMGMDIARRVVEGLGGALSMRTEAGAGTSFTMRLPTTLSVVDVFTFECGAQRFAAPLSAVDEVIEADAPVRGPSLGAGAAVAMVERGGAMIPMVDLEAALGMGDGRGARRKAMVLRRGGEALAFAVDRVLGLQEVVVRPLTDPLLRVRGVSGAADLGDGRPTLVLDLAALREAVGGGAA
ncbi:MAG: chemotaxis protein CheW [Polyangiales bacterium]